MNNFWHIFEALLKMGKTKGKKKKDCVSKKRFSYS